MTLTGKLVVVGASLITATAISWMLYETSVGTDRRAAAVGVKYTDAPALTSIVRSYDLTMVDAHGVPVFTMKENGDVVVKGETIGNSKEIFNVMNRWAQGWRNCKCTP